MPGGRKLLNYSELYLDPTSANIESDFQLFLQRRQALIDSAIEEKNMALLAKIRQIDEHNLAHLKASQEAVADSLGRLSKVIKYGQ